MAGNRLTNLYSVLESRDITLLTKVCIVKAMVFPVVMCGCENWTIRQNTTELMPSNVVLEDSSKSLGQQGGQTSQLYEISILNIYWKD